MRLLLAALSCILFLHPAQAAWVSLATNVQGEDKSLSMVKTSPPDDWLVSADVRFDGLEPHYTAYVSLNDCLSHGSGVISFIDPLGPTEKFHWTENGTKAYDVVALSLCEWAEFKTRDWGFIQAGYALPRRHH